MPDTRIANQTIQLQNDHPDINVALTTRQGEAPGIEYLDVEVTAASPTRPDPITLSWEQPSIDMQLRTGTQWRYALCGMGSGRLRASAAQQAPLLHVQLRG